MNYLPMSLCFIWTKFWEKKSNSLEMPTEFLRFGKLSEKKHFIFLSIVCSILFHFFPTDNFNRYPAFSCLLFGLCILFFFFFSFFFEYLKRNSFYVCVTLRLFYHFGFVIITIFQTFSIILSGNERGNKLSLQRITTFEMLRFLRSKIESKLFFRHETWMIGLSQFWFNHFYYCHATLILYSVSF